MSLFGSSPTDASPGRNRNSLFDDDDDGHAPGSNSNNNDSAAAGGHRSSLFDDGLGGGSPWSMPTPRSKRSGSNSEMIRNVMRGATVPEEYIDLFDEILSATGAVTVGALERLLGESQVKTSDWDRILDLIAGRNRDDGTVVNREAFNVFLALVALAEDGDEYLGFDAVDDRKRNLPIPTIAPTKPVPPPLEQPPRQPSPSIQERPIQTPPSPPVMSHSAPSQEDPWGSPELHEGHNHGPVSKTNGATAPTAYPDAPDVGSLEAPSLPPSRPSYTPAITEADDLQASLRLPRQPTMTNAWGPPPQAQTGGFGAPPGFGAQQGFGPQPGGFGDPTDNGSVAGSSLRPTFGSIRGAPSGGGVRAEETVTVTALPDKEGMFMFQHRNYQVASARRGSRVVRRYSDFVWLLECLQKRYPFRQLPLMPPKRLAVNGHYLSADTAFIERRRRGLARFANALVRHPVLREETLVVMFLTVPTELAVWRKQATISVQEEFVDKPLPPHLEESLPADIEHTFETVRSGIRRSSETYIGLCNLLERIEKRHEGVAADYRRFSQALESLTDASEATYKMDTSEVVPLNDGLVAVAKHLNTAQSIMEDEIKAWDIGVLEDLKRHRDALVSMRELFERKDKYAGDNIPYLEKRIRTTEEKLKVTRLKPKEQVKEGELEKMEASIVADRESIVRQRARGILIKECVRDELIYFQGSQYHVSKLQQDWAQERIKYAELYADNWKSLGHSVDGMPLGE
ncbi:Sorting nexin mvp1 [Orbilia javanica]|uniref:Sorting nexin MVP1 n=2 Tax=Orbilia javanica TaxID=47235 RepID=A0AAN8MPU0_9PEZI